MKIYYTIHIIDMCIYFSMSWEVSITMAMKFWINQSLAIGLKPQLIAGLDYGGFAGFEHLSVLHPTVLRGMI